MNFLRTGWELLYWNFRKAHFRRRGGRAPCQHPSDSGRAFETGCLACGSRKNPMQFRKICPLLVETPDGIRCSVDASDVRPFWKPVLVFYGKAIVATYVVALLALFGFLKSIRYPVRAADLAWPRSWSKIPAARTSFLVEKARRALAAGNPRAAALFLQNARERDPGNYEVGLDLALLDRTLSPANANAEFARLMARYPEKSNATALRWLEAMLVHAEFEPILGLAGQQLKADPEHGNTWAKALLFSAARLGATEELKKLLTDPAPALAPWRDSLRLEIAVEENRKPAAEALLRGPWPPGAPAYAKYHRLRARAKITGAIQCLDEIQQHEADLDPATKLILVLDLLSELQFTSRLADQVKLLLSRQNNADTLKMLCAHVIRYQDGATFRSAYVAAQALDPPVTDPSLWFSLLAAAGAARDAAAVQEIVQLLDARSEARAIALPVRDFFNGESNHSTFTAFLPGLGLPLEETYAVLENPPPPIRSPGKAR